MTYRDRIVKRCQSLGLNVEFVESYSDIGIVNITSAGGETLASVCGIRAAWRWLKQQYGKEGTNACD